MCRLLLFLLQTRPRWYASAAFWFGCALVAWWLVAENRPHLDSTITGTYPGPTLWFGDGSFGLEHEHVQRSPDRKGWSPICDASINFDGFRLHITSSLHPIAQWTPIKLSNVVTAAPPPDALPAYVGLLRERGEAPISRMLEEPEIPDQLASKVAAFEPLWDPVTGRGALTVYYWPGFPLWTLEMLAMTVMAVAACVGLPRMLQVSASRHADKAMRHGLCPACGYSLLELRGQPGPVVCPECGTNMRDVGKLASD